MSRALELADQAWRLAEGDETDAVAQTEQSGLVRFANSTVHQPTLINDESVTVRVVRDGRVGAAFTNRTDREGLRSAAKRAAEAADNSPKDPSWPGLPASAEVPRVEGFDLETARLSPADQAERAWTTIKAAPDYGLFGYFTSGTTELAVASSTGLAVEQQMTDATALALAASDGQSGYAEASSHRAGDLSPETVGREAANKAQRTSGATTLEPGTYRAFLEPYAFSELLFYFGFTSLGGLALLEGRSNFADRLGERLFHPSFSLYDDGGDPRGFAKAFDFEGVPKQPVTIVEAGVARDVVWDRRTALRAEREEGSTGHALPAATQASGPIPFNLSVPGGEANWDDLVALVDDGIYITRLHYLGIVEPRSGTFTGMTRDGTFRIRAGKVAEPLVNLRFTTSFPELLKQLLGLSAGVTLVNRNDFYGARFPSGTIVPAVATRAFAIVGVGSSPGL